MAQVRTAGRRGKGHACVTGVGDGLDHYPPSRKRTKRLLAILFHSPFTALGWPMYRRSREMVFFSPHTPPHPKYPRPHAPSPPAHLTPHMRAPCFPSRAQCCKRPLRPPHTCEPCGRLPSIWRSWRGETTWW
eukprot:336286-Chlamydomonas_euryale.AAC.2